MHLNLRLTRLTAFVAFAALSQTSFSSIGAAQTAPVEVHPIKTMTLTDQQFLNGAKDGPEVIIGGELRLPRLSNERLSAVVLLHGSSGIAAYVNDWIPVLNSWRRDIPCRQLYGTGLNERGQRSGSAWAASPGV
jgi:hypothetical protein